MKNSTSGPIKNSYVVAEGFYAGEYPGSRSEVEMKRKILSFQKANVTDFIDLTCPGELNPYALFLPPEARRHAFPIIDQSVPKSVEYMAEILNTVEALLADNRVIYVHCWGGIGRTGTVVACWLAWTLGLDGDHALRELARRWTACPKSAWSDSPENETQRNFVRRYAVWCKEQLDTNAE
ncbi:MAG: protein-tyrosine phosphatase family protein [Planctomycetia bacterium]|nr:protein-tyrosine phosphatase family protein [Planctomycetia bacterium]